MYQYLVLRYGWFGVRLHVVRTFMASVRAIMESTNGAALSSLIKVLDSNVANV